uniref:Uncharacterized protein n=1 Tax=Leersia perrieri TaxID=77586 RepID=A0A0D9WQX7_9ORYZ
MAARGVFIIRRHRHHQWGSAAADHPIFIFLDPDLAWQPRPLARHPCGDGDRRRHFSLATTHR